MGVLRSGAGIEAEGSVARSRTWRTRALGGTLAAATGFGALISASAAADRNRLELSRATTDGWCSLAECADGGPQREAGPLESPGAEASTDRSSPRLSAPVRRRSRPVGGPSMTSPTSVTPPTTTTTVGQLRIWDRQPPRVSDLRAGGEVPDGPDGIVDGPACGSTQISVEAVVVESSTLRSVVVRWSFPGAHGWHEGSKAMTAETAGKFTTELGPFPRGTAPDGAGVLIRWWVEAIDKSGNVGRADAPDGSDGVQADERVTLVHCDH